MPNFSNGRSGQDSYFRGIVWRRCWIVEPGAVYFSLELTKKRGFMQATSQYLLFTKRKSFMLFRFSNYVDRMDFELRFDIEIWGWRFRVPICLKFTLFDWLWVYSYIDWLCTYGFVVLCQCWCEVLTRKNETDEEVGMVTGSTIISLSTGINAHVLSLPVPTLVGFFQTGRSIHSKTASVGTFPSRNRQEKSYCTTLT